MSKSRNTIKRFAKCYLYIALPALVPPIAFLAAGGTLPSDPLWYEVAGASIAVLACVICLAKDGMRERNKQLARKVADLQSSLVEAEREDAEEERQS